MNTLYMLHLMLLWTLTLASIQLAVPLYAQEPPLEGAVGIPVLVQMPTSETRVSPGTSRTGQREDAADSSMALEKLMESLSQSAGSPPPPRPLLELLPPLIDHNGPTAVSVAGMTMIDLGQFANPPAPLIVEARLLGRGSDGRLTIFGLGYRFQDSSRHVFEGSTSELDIMCQIMIKTAGRKKHLIRLKASDCDLKLK